MTDKKWLFLALVFGASVLVVSRCNEQSKAAIKAEEHFEAEEHRAEDKHKLAQQMSWGYPELPAVLPELGSPPSVMTDLAPIGLMPDGTRDVGVRIFDLIDRHPIEEVRLGYRARNQLHLQLVERSGFYAMAARSEWGHTPRVDLLVVDPKMIDDIDTPEEIRDTWLVLYHEYQHFKRFDSMPPEVDRVVSSDPASIVNRQDRELACVDIWQAEFEAYTLECQLANRWGGSQLLGQFCLMVEEPATFKRALFVMLSNSPMIQARPHCLPYWAREAGHPYWEAYK